MLQNSILQRSAHLSDKICFKLDENENKYRLTYAEFRIEIQKAAGALLNMGIQPGDRVILLTENRPEAMIAYLAVLTAGATAVLLDVSSQPSELKKFIEIVDARAVLVSHKGLAAIEPSFVPFLAVLHIQRQFAPCEGYLAKIPVDRLDTADGDIDVATIVFTSGTSGYAKAVMLTHENLISQSQSGQAAIELTENDTMLSFLPIHHVTSLVQNLVGLHATSTLIFVGKIEGAAILSALQSMQPTYMGAVPLLLDLFLKNIEDEIAKKGPLAQKIIHLLLNVSQKVRATTSVNIGFYLFGKLQKAFGGHLKCIVSGGAGAKPLVVKKLEGFGFSILEAYGLTETTGPMCSNKLNKSCPGKAGKPFPTMQFALRDDEICVKGPLVMKGYFRDPAATQYALRDGWFYTGDLGEIDQHGIVTVTGRRREMIVLSSGKKAIPADVEAQYLHIPGIAELAVFGMPSLKQAGEEISAAVVLTHEWKKADRKKMLEEAIYHRSLELPSTLQIQHIFFVDELPKTAMQKVKRMVLKKALEEQYYTAHSNENRSSHSIKNINETQKIICDLLAQVIGEPINDLDKNLFSYGINSLKAADIASKIHDQFCTMIQGVTLLYKYPTARAIAQYIEDPSNIQANQQFQLEKIENASENKIWHPVSFAQQGMWLIDQAAQKNSYYYNLPFAVSFTGRLNEAALQSAINGLIERHSVLRTVYQFQDGKCWQKINPVEAVKIEKKKTTLDKMHLDLQRSSVNAFDLEMGPLYRFTLYQITNDFHVLFANVHHIVCDGGSFHVLSMDFQELYNAASENRIAKLASLPFLYSDYCYWQEKQYTDDALKKDLDFWKNKLTGLEPLALPIDFPRPVKKQHVTQTIPFEFSAELTKQLQNFSRENDCTLFVVLNAIFSILLARHCNEESVVFGSPVSGRNQSDLQSIVGLFVNILVFKNNHAEDISFTDFVKQVKQNCMEAYEYQSLPFWKLAHALLKERDFSRHPIVQVVFNFQSQAEMVDIHLTGLRAEILETPSNFAEFDLALSVKECSDKLVCDFEFDTALFSRETIQTMLDHLLNIMHSVIEDAAQSIHKIKLFSDAEYNKIAFDFNQTYTTSVNNNNLYLLFSERAKKIPDGIAVSCGNEKLTYLELQKCANRLANSICSLPFFNKDGGLQKNKLIIIKLDRGIQFIISMLAVLKTGYAFVVIAIDYPEERIRSIEEDTEALCTIDDEFFDILLHDRSEPHETTFYPGELASVIYTSGSTGKPKGVMDSHKNIIRITTNDSLLPIEAGMQVAQTSSATFDGFLYETFFSLLNGGTLHIAGKDILLSGDMTNWVKKNKVSHMFLTTALLKYFSEHENLLFSYVRYMVTGGEQLHSSVVDSIFKHPENRKLCLSNIYGPTENGIWSTLFTVDSEVLYQGPIPIGKPVTNTTCYILDKNKQLCPVGTAGECYVGGDGVALGYLNKSELTSTYFIDNPFQSQDDKARDYNARLYRTGDRVRQLRDGNLVFINRIDNQIKLNGFRVDLGEVEHVLQLHPKVSQCVVLVSEDEQGKNQKLTAYVKNYPLLKFSEASMKCHVKKYLPDYMVPARYILLDQFPMNNNGKIDKKKIVSQFQPKKDRETPVRKPQSLSEKFIHSIWCETFSDSKEISVDDNFFALGGNSLFAGILISKIREKSGVILPLNSVFTHPTIEEISKVFDESTLKSVPNVVQKTMVKPQRKSRRMEKLLLRYLLIPVLRAAFFPVASITVKGSENIPDSGPLIVTSNHTNFMDTPILLCIIGTLLGKISDDPGFVASMRRKKSLHWFFKWIGEPIYVTRGYEGRDMESLMQASDILEAGGMVCLAPEGTFNDGGRLIRARPGVGFLATKTRAPILPIAIYGHENPFKKWLKLKRLAVEIHIGSTLYVSSEMGSGKFQQFSDEVMIAISKMMPEKYHGHYHQFCQPEVEVE